MRRVDVFTADGIGAGLIGIAKMPALDKTRIGDEVKRRGVAGEIFLGPGRRGYDDLPPQVLAYRNELKDELPRQRMAEGFAALDIAGKFAELGLRPGGMRRRARQPKDVEKKTQFPW